DIAQYRAGRETDARACRTEPVNLLLEVQGYRAVKQTVGQARRSTLAATLNIGLDADHEIEKAWNLPIVADLSATDCTRRRQMGRLRLQQSAGTVGVGAAPPDAAPGIDAKVEAGPVVYLDGSLIEWSLDRGLHRNVGGLRADSAQGKNGNGERTRFQSQL